MELASSLEQPAPSDLEEEGGSKEEEEEATRNDDKEEADGFATQFQLPPLNGAGSGAGGGAPPHSGTVSCSLVQQVFPFLRTAQPQSGTICWHDSCVAW